MKAQTDRTRVEGNYFLTGVHEVASVLVLKPGFTFDFFYSCGALDRFGKGSWKVVNSDASRVVLHSRPRPANDFSLVSTGRNHERLTTIKINDKRADLLRCITVRLHTSRGITDKFTDPNGMVTITRQPVKKIELMFELCPDRFSLFEVADPELNCFESRIQPWITDIFFEGLALTIGNNRLVGSHPLSDGNYQYLKTENRTAGL